MAGAGGWMVPMRLILETADVLLTISLQRRFANVGEMAHTSDPASLFKRV